MRLASLPLPRRLPAHELPQRSGAAGATLLRTHVRRAAIACCSTGIALLRVAAIAAQPSGTGGSPPARGSVGARVVSLVPSVTDLAVAIGAASQLVGRTEFDRDPRLASLPSVGGATDPNLEIVARLHPDVVITWDDSAAPRVLGKLRELGVRSLPLKTSTLADLRTNLQRIGALFGRERAADSLWRSVDESLRATALANHGLSRPAVFFVVWRRPLMTVGHAGFLDTLITIAGGYNVFHDLPQAWPTVSIEALARRGATVIIVPTSPAQSIDDVLDDPNLGRLIAVTRARVVSVDAGLVNRPGPRIGDAARAIADAIR